MLVSIAMEIFTVQTFFINESSRIIQFCAVTMHMNEND